MMEDALFSKSIIISTKFFKCFQMTEINPPEKLRIDKWLWAARFFKTRQLAVEAINGGKIHINGQRIKPSKEIQAGVEIRIHKASVEWNITVAAINKQRRPAKEACQLYTESAESIQARVDATAIRRKEQQAPSNRPNKRERRKLHKFKQQL